MPEIHPFSWVKTRDDIQIFRQEAKKCIENELKMKVFLGLVEEKMPEGSVICIYITH